MGFWCVYSCLALSARFRTLQIYRTFGSGGHKDGEGVALPQSSGIRALGSCIKTLWWWHQGGLMWCRSRAFGWKEEFRLCGSIKAAEDYGSVVVALRQCGGI